MVDPQAHPCRARSHAQCNWPTHCMPTGNGRLRTTKTPAGYQPDAVSSGRRALANMAQSMLCLAARDTARCPVARQNLPALQRCQQHDRPLWRTGRAGQQRPRTGCACARQVLQLVCWRSLGAGQMVQPASGQHRPRWRHTAACSHFDEAPRLQPEKPQPRPQRDLQLLQRQPRRLPPRRCSRLYVLGERVIELDAINPQVAARLARALDRWKKLAAALPKCRARSHRPRGG